MLAIIYGLSNWLGDGRGSSCRQEKPRQKEIGAVGLSVPIDRGRGVIFGGGAEE